jgi:SAM-dependent methyltransferase
MDLPRVVFFGRTGADALAFFNLDLAAWRGQRVLDCPGGPGSFTALARAAGVESVAADPLYDLSLAELEQRCRDDVAFTMERLARSASLRPDFDLPLFAQGKLEALEAFLADRREHPEAYRAAALPSLPFEAGSFDLVLCGHLLFCYAPIADGGLSEQPDFDLHWHRRALAELLRVSRREVRLYPAHTIERRPKVHPWVEPLLATLPPDWQGQLEDTTYDEGFEGATPMLRLRRQAADGRGPLDHESNTLNSGC